MLAVPIKRSSIWDWTRNISQISVEINLHFSKAIISNCRPWFECYSAAMADQQELQKLDTAVASIRAEIEKASPSRKQRIYEAVALQTGPSPTDVLDSLRCLCLNGISVSRSRRNDLSSPRRRGSCNPCKIRRYLSLTLPMFPWG